MLTHFYMVSLLRYMIYGWYGYLRWQMHDDKTPWKNFLCYCVCRNHLNGGKDLWNVSFEFIVSMLFSTHWSLMMHICIIGLVSIGSGKGLSPVRCQAIIKTNADFWSNGLSGMCFSEILIKIQTIYFKESYLKMLCAICLQSCLSPYVNICLGTQQRNLQNFAMLTLCKMPLDALTCGESDCHFIIFEGLFTIAFLQLILKVFFIKMHW